MKEEALTRVAWPEAETAGSGFVAACRVIARNRLALLGLIIVGIWLLTALFAPYIATHDAYEINIANRLKGPSAEHWLGTDYLGRDTFSRIVFGARTALQVAIGAVFLGAFFGIPIGAISGFAGRWIDSAIMRVMDAIMAFPGRLLAIALVASMGGGLFSLYIALGINSIPSYARIVRGVVLSQKEKEYVEAARMTGESDLNILFFQVLPNCLSPLLVRLSLDFAHAILAESSLSFLGLGLPPPTASWGLMLKEVTPFLQLQPLAAFFPGLTISLIILGFNLLGDGLRDVFDPRQYER
ncbi:MAG TPA: ABC transporter permease [Candidatus Acidoferrales bacterium]|nr:ABC transporter permease [Candidatus Acidoferrales bacterium]